MKKWNIVLLVVTTLGVTAIGLWGWELILNSTNEAYGLRGVLSNLVMVTFLFGVFLNFLDGVFDSDYF